jgi:hypothetical protein
MLVDIEGEENLEYGIDWGLEEGEELPDDIEELTLAQYTAWKFMCVLRGIGDEEYSKEVEESKSDKPSGIVMPVNGH